MYSENVLPKKLHKNLIKWSNYIAFLVNKFFWKSLIYLTINICIILPNLKESGVIVRITRPKSATLVNELGFTIKSVTDNEIMKWFIIN